MSFIESPDAIKQPATPPIEAPGAAPVASPSPVDIPSAPSTEAVAAPSTVSVETSAPIAPPPPAVPDLTDDVISRALEVASGGKYRSAAELQALQAAAEERATLQTRVAELERSQNPFADDVLKQLNEMRRAGTSNAELARFLEYQDIDPQALDPYQAVRMAAKLDNPSYDDAMLDALLSRQGLQAYVEGGEPEPLDRVALDQARKAAVARLSEIKVQAATPQSVQAAQADEARKVQALQAYGTVARTVVGSLQKISVQAGDIPFDFPVPAEMIPAAEKFLIDTGVSGGWELNEAGAQAAGTMLQNFMYMALGPQITQAALTHGIAMGREQQAKVNAGPVPQPAGIPAPPPAQVQSGPPQARNGYI
jgi:hypothetical protein